VLIRVLWGDHMLRVLSFVLVVIAASWAMPVTAAEYESKELADAGNDYRKNILDTIQPNQRKPNLIPRLRKDADQEIQAKRYSRAIEDLEKAIAYGADDGLVWLRLAQAHIGNDDQDNTLASAYNAYRKSTDPVERGNALFIIARDYDRHDKYKEALATFEAGLGFTASQGVATRVDQLKALVAYRVIKVEVEAEADAARACLRFNEPIATKGDVSYGAYVRSTPNLDGIVTGRGDTVCLEGLKHGQTYQVQLLTGFPSETGEKTLSDFKTNVVVPDRKSSISFAGTGYVLPREGSAGLPVTTINLDRVKIRILKVNERNLVPSIDAEKLTMTFGADDVDDVANRSGSLIWQGEMTIAGDRNRAVSTAIPLKDVLKNNGPGVYLAVVERADVKAGEDTEPATNWILVSNLGLTTYTGTDGMAVAVRSLADAKPVSGVALRLYAHNNTELGTATTDADGIGRFAGGLLHGKGGDEPYAVMAYGAEGDFNFLEVGRAAFDLSDRGVSGRDAPGPVDAYLYTDRGIYRPGESVHLMALVRDDKADAVANVPLTLRLLRPDGIVVDSKQLDAGDLGAHYQRYVLPRDARMGTWEVELRVDPKAPAISTVGFRVEDFVPPTLKVDLSAGDAPIHPNEVYPVSIAGKYYYGAPGAGLSVEANAQIAFDDNPFPTEPDFRFGLVGEKFNGVRKDIDVPATDADGKSSLSIELTDLPDLTRPIAATIEVSVYEPSGRAIVANLTRPIRERAMTIGLRSSVGDDAVPEGEPAKLDVIAVDEMGKRIAAQGLRWLLVRESWRYDWYSENGMWRHRVRVRDEPIDSGAVDIADGAAANLSKTLPAGRYRWEVTDTAGGAQSSLRFHVGWWVEAELPDVPDKLSATLDKTSYQAGDTAKLFVKAPYAGEAELVIAADKVLSLKSFTLPEGGTTLEIPVDASWGSGVYALVTAYRPPVAPGSGGNGMSTRGPGRAVGVASIGIDPAPRVLGVTLSGPDVARPRAPVSVPIKLAGLAQGEEAYVTLAAVDEAVLKLTDFDSPAPADYFYGKQKLGVELRDLYGRLIEPHANAVGVLRSGGDSFAKRSVAGLPDKSNQVVALFSGIVKLDADGAATVKLDLPDFQGQLRLMAVAVAAHKVGAASGQMIVRDPVVTMVSLPRFLAPGDNARLAVTINNLEGPAGDYALKMTATGAGSFVTPVERAIHLDAGANFSDGVIIAGTTMGNVAVHLDLAGPSDLHLARDFKIGVRPAQSYQLRRFVGQMAPSQSVTLDDASADEFLPGTAEAQLSVSPRPQWDVPGLLQALDRYPYGCLEQTTSRALPLLYVDEVASLWQADPGFSPAKQIDAAIGHIAELQRSDGSFGVWNDTDNTVPWLDAYATDFLMRAKEHGNTVPDFAIKGAIGWLHDYVQQEHKEDKEILTALAYAHYVLARAKADDLGALRYFNDTQMAQLPTQLAKAQLGAALASYGDATRAAAAYAAALAPAPKRNPKLRYIDYGSELRDSAAALAFAASDPGSQGRLTAIMDRIAELFAHANRTSTQEQAWLLLAAEAAAKLTGNSMTIAVGDKASETRSTPEYFRRAIGSGATSLTVANRGTTPLWRNVSITGVVKADLPAESNGYAVARYVFKPDGKPADLTKVRQTDLLVVELKGSRKNAAEAARALVVDLLPAGFEIQNADPPAGDASGGYGWLKDLTSTAYTEARDDRYIAALDLPGGTSEFTLAYVVRAVTPGEFKYPALDVEDMYDPETYGRTAMGKLIVQPR
jgi:alpha-2-macroglobulin